MQQHAKQKMSSLASLVTEYLNLELPKPSNERLGDWAVDALSYEQVQYAATDAYACYALLYEIRRLFAQSKGREYTIMFNMFWFSVNFFGSLFACVL